MDAPARAAVARGLALGIGAAAAAGLPAPSYALWLALAPLAAAALGWIRWSELTGELHPWRTAADTILVLAATLVPAAALVGLFPSLWTLSAPALGVPALATLALGVGLEEWYFRGAVQSLLGRASRRRLRLLGCAFGWELPAAALLFALAHLPRLGPVGAAQIFLPGLVLGWCRVHSRGIFAGLLVHLAYNVWAECVRAAAG